MSDTVDNNQVATKKDVQKLEKDIQKLEGSIDTLAQSTKKDIKELDAKFAARFATKSELKNVEKNLRAEILRVEEKVETLEDGQQAIKQQLTAVEQKLETKIDRILQTLDSFVGRVDNLTTDNEVGTHHTRELRIQIDGHEKRIKHLESSTPGE